MGITKTEKNKTIVQINPHLGNNSTGKIVLALDEGYSNFGFNSFVCYSQSYSTRKNAYKYGNILEKYVSAFFTRIDGNPYGHAFFSTCKLLAFLKKKSPDYVHIHCINCYDANIYRLLNFLKRRKIKTIVTEHAEFFHTGGCSHAYDCPGWKSGCFHCPHRYFALKTRLFGSAHVNWIRMKKSFANFKHCSIVSVSPWLLERSEQAPIFCDIPKKWIGNGLNTQIFKYVPCEGNKTKKKRVLFVGSDSKSGNKGLSFLKQLAELRPDLDFYVVGITRNKGSQKNIFWVGPISNQNVLAKLYANCEVTILCSKVETFSMVLAESLCCGTPVAGFFAGGPETIAMKEYCKFSKYGDVVDLSSNISALIDSNFEKEVMSQKARVLYSQEKMVTEYVAIIKDL